MPGHLERLLDALMRPAQQPRAQRPTVLVSPHDPLSPQQSDQVTTTSADNRWDYALWGEGVWV